MRIINVGKGLLLLLGVLLIERGLHRQRVPDLSGCNWFVDHPNGGGV